MDVNSTKLPVEVLQHARDSGAAAYLNAYIRLMARELDVDDSDTASVTQMILEMIGPMNHATEAIWRAMMDDNKGMDEALKRFHKSLTHV